MSTAVKLVIAAVIISSVTAWMACLGTTSSWKYYLTVDECLSDAQELVKKPLRVNGRVEVGSLEIMTDRNLATFRLCGTAHPLPVQCAGPFPDNLAEDIDVVVEGRLDGSGLLRGEKVLTRCASKYTPVTNVPTNAGTNAPRPKYTEGRSR